MTAHSDLRTRRKTAFRPWGCSFIRTSSERPLSQGIDLRGVPQIPEDCFTDLFRVGSLTAEQESRCSAAIHAACHEIKRRIFEVWGVGQFDQFSQEQESFDD